MFIILNKMISCDKVIMYNLLKFWSLYWHTSGSDSLPLCLKIDCLKKIFLKLSKTVRCNKIKKTSLVYALIHHHFIQWNSPLSWPPYCQIISFNNPNAPLDFSTINKICKLFFFYFFGILFLHNFFTHH